MPRKKTVNAERLIQAVEKQIPSKEIMAEFGIKTSAQLKALYHDALVEQGRINGIIGARSRQGAGAGPKVPEIVINKRGSLVLSRQLVEELGYNIDDSFKVRKTRAGLNLRKI